MERHHKFKSADLEAITQLGSENIGSYSPIVKLDMTDHLNRCELCKLSRLVVDLKDEVLQAIVRLKFVS